MGKLIAKVPLNSDTLEMSECSDGIWLWDTTREMNLSIKKKTPTDALVEALHYYQERLTKVEQEYRILTAKVDAFVAQVTEESED